MFLCFSRACCVAFFCSCGVVGFEILGSFVFFCCQFVGLSVCVCRFGVLCLFAVAFSCVRSSVYEL